VPIFAPASITSTPAEFWDAHESWETIWLEAESEVHLFLQGLIQLAAAYSPRQARHLSGRIAPFDAAFEKLDTFRALVRHRSHLGRGGARRHREWVAALLAQGTGQERLDVNDFPKITSMIRRFRHLNTGERTSDLIQFAHPQHPNATT